MDIIERLSDRAESYRQSGPSAEHTSALLDEARAEIELLPSLALDMGRVIRQLDESGEHSEFWTQDGGYIIDSRASH